MKRLKGKKQGGGTAAGRPLRIHRQNVCVLAAALTLIVTGMLLMLPARDVKSEPGGRYKPVPLEGEFSARRIRLAPAVAWTGFMLVPLAVMAGGKGEDENTEKARWKDKEAE